MEITKNDEKVAYYKEFCQQIFTITNSGLSSIEFINDVLHKFTLSEKNLNDHKTIIKDLLSNINSRKEEIYVYQSENEILKKELNFWVYDFEHIKNSLVVRVIICI